MRLSDRPHHDGSGAYVSDGAPAPGAKVTVRLRVPASFPAAEVAVRQVMDGEPVVTPCEVERSDGDTTWWTGTVQAHNPSTPYRFVAAAPDGTQWQCGAGGVTDYDLPDHSDHRLLIGPGLPDWVRDAVVYEIFPDRYARSAAAASLDPDDLPEWAVPIPWDADLPSEHDPKTAFRLAGGDLQGIGEHLDHIQSLGVDTVYLTPVFPGRSNHRYDAWTFDHIDPLLGGDVAYARLAEQLHGRGMKLMGDLTTNHSGDAHEWFLAAQADPDSVEAGFYHFDEHPGAYASWLGVPSLPKFDLRGAELRRRLVDGPDSVIAQWLKPPYALDGWRIDVANMTGRYREVDLTVEIARTIRRTMGQHNADAWLVAEHCHDASYDLAHPDSWHGTMNYTAFSRPLWAWLWDWTGTRPWSANGSMPMPRWDGIQALRSLRAYTGAIPWRALTGGMSLLSSHDSPRVRTIVGSAERQRVALAVQATMPGVPMVFAGDEFGLTGDDGEHSRTPMPWNGERPVDSGTLEDYRTLLGLRRRVTALRRGGLRWLDATEESMTYARTTPEETVLVHAVRGPQTTPVRLALADLGVRPEVEVLFGEAPRVEGNELVLPADGPAAHVWRLPGEG